MRIGEVLGALSLATDLAVGCPLETALRTCVLATRLARTVIGSGTGSAADVLEVRRVALLRHLGCTAYAHETALLAAGDEHDVMQSFAGVDRGLRALAGRATRLAREETIGKRIGAIVRVMAHPGARTDLMSAQCAQAVALARDLQFSDGVVVALGQIYERHDGLGGPAGLAGEDIRLSARLLHLAEIVEIHHRLAGRETAVAEVQRRRGKHVASAIADAFLAQPDHYWNVLEASSVWDAYMDDDDHDQPGIGVLDLAEAFGRFTDLKSPYTLGHSKSVAALAADATEDRDANARVRIAGLLHDLGSVSVPNGIWEKRGPLNAAEWERVRLHGYYTERILARTPLLADAASIAGAHHERLDGSGYHRNANAPALDRAARLIAVADAYHAMRSVRPHRAALPADAVVDRLAAEARDGRLCRRAVDSVLAAAGHRAPRAELPGGLSPREAEVLVELARGRTNKQIASALKIAVRTANHHVENIYAKINTTTRAAAALFAVRHDLVTLDPESGPRE